MPGRHPGQSRPSSTPDLAQKHIFGEIVEMMGGEQVVGIHLARPAGQKAIAQDAPGLLQAQVLTPGIGRNIRSPLNEVKGQAGTKIRD